MLNRILIFIIFIHLGITTTAQGQTIQGYPFDSYPAQISKTKKAFLDLKSHPLGHSYRTMIKQQYSNGKINFGGHFIATIWGAGVGLTLGAMVDIFTGKIYQLPLTEHNSSRGADRDTNLNRLFKPNSNLFVCYTCRNNMKETGVDLIYSFYEWDDLQMKFNLLATKKVTVKMDLD